MKRVLRAALRWLGLHSSNAIQERRAFICNVLFAAVITLMATGTIMSSLLSVIVPMAANTRANSTVPLLSMLAILGFFLCVYVLSRRERSVFVAYVLVIALLVLALYMQVEWGVDVTVGLLFQMLAVVMAGILVSTRFAIFVLFVVASCMGIVARLHHVGILTPNTYWRSQSWSLTDAVMTIGIFGIIIVVCSLANWQSEYALARAEALEAALREQRDKLGEMVEERTRELRTSEMEQLASMHRFAEFGRISSGLFHNLGNLLTALTIHLDRLNVHQKEDVHEAQSDLHKAMQVNEHMREFVHAVRRQLAGHRHIEQFSVTDAVQETVKVLSHHAEQSEVVLTVQTDKHVWLSGDPTIFTRIATNLIANGIEAYHAVDTREGGRREVMVVVDANKEHVLLKVKDWGCGIAKDLRERIFEPFFTTKRGTHGIGIGLALLKEMVERDFGGSTVVESEEGKFTEFTVYFPRR